MTTSKQSNNHRPSALISVFTEIPDQINKNKIMPKAEHRGWVLYDGECRLCMDLAARFEAIIRRAGFTLLPLQSETGRKLLANRSGDLLREMAVVDQDGEVRDGAEAVLFLARQFRWTRPLPALAALPGGRKVADALYRRIAANRHCYGGACATRRSLVPPVFVTAAVLLPVIALVTTHDLDPWITMWALAGGIYFACKFLMLARHFPSGPTLRQTVPYLFLWPGMDPRPFAHGVTTPAQPGFYDAFAPAAKLTAGILLLWVAVPAVGAEHALVAGWTGMIGMILVLHFGSFHLLALLWQRRGVPVRPLMDAPLQAASLADFWGGRWNRAFSDLARDLIYRPYWRRFGPAACTMLVFLISGVVHDVVISIPAGGGYGWPTLFFLIQGLGILTERTRSGKRAGLGAGLRGRIFVLATLGIPLAGLFHPTFIHQVILPFLETIKSL